MRRILRHAFVYRFKFIAVLTACSLLSIEAQGKFIFGFIGGYTLLNIPTKYANSFGPSVVSSSGATPIGETALGNASSSFSAFSFGVTFGFIPARISKSSKRGSSRSGSRSSFLSNYLGIDFRGRFVRGRSPIDHYISSSTGHITSGTGDADYSAINADIGLRCYVSRHLYFRPHIGEILSPSIKATFLVGNNYSASWKAGLAYGAGIMFSVGGSFRTEVGLDYTSYSASFGGSIKETSLIVSPTFQF